MDINCYRELQESELSVLKKNDRQVVGKFFFRKDLELFKGHFPGNPILPGVLQIEMVKYVLEKSLLIPLRIQSVKKTKFPSMIHPENVVTTEVTINKNGTDFLEVRSVVRAEGVIAGKSTLTLTKKETD